MTNQLITFWNENKKDMGIFALIGGAVYLFSKNIMPTEMSTLQASLGSGIIDKVVNIAFQTLLLFIILGIAIGLILSFIIRRPK